MDGWHMNEVIPNLWLGDISSALDPKNLREKNIHSILTAMRGKVVVEETFNRLQISINDVESEDILRHLVVAITFIQAELDKGRGVLVHCLAGISRSTSMVAAYLMYSRGLSPEDALTLIRKARPQVEPNDSFLAQLQIFHKASCRVSMHDKATRMFYLERMVKNIIDGEPVDTEALPLPRTSPREATPSSSNEPRCRIRCKMCRQILATRENMQDHGQLSTLSPSVAYSPVIPSPPAFSSIPDIEPPEDILEHPSEKPAADTSVIDEAEELGRQLSEKVTLDERQEKEESNKEPNTDAGSRGETKTEEVKIPTVVTSDETPSSQPAPRTQAVSAAPSSRPPVTRPTRRPVSMSSVPATAAELSAQQNSDPAFVGLRPELRVTPAPSPSLLALPRAMPTVNPPPNSPILVNPKCSGYFVEPLKWMDAFLDKGELSGKIICPNKKCNAKLGNYDWAGLCCGCKEWIVPGFCISRSKVDEIV
ncbi:ual-specificity phosphatase domain-containing protein [Phanerochaete sordida]|uniref:protein-tyrosine-phosphatase n=1 Tax=Phanerochaete sordida TaxID=48140 RepID=A0A9P3GPP3_9APHY|nr:ual-specificity phosphatase domain-containing protein [Phanerochaete sordida]